MKILRLFFMFTALACANMTPVAYGQTDIASSPHKVKKLIVSQAYSLRWHVANISDTSLTIEKPYTNFFGNILYGSVERPLISQRIIYTFHSSDTGTRISSETSIVLRSGTPDEEVLPIDNAPLESMVRLQMDCVRAKAVSHE
jgi:hypothetical protein